MIFYIIWTKLFKEWTLIGLFVPALRILTFLMNFVTQNQPERNEMGFSKHMNKQGEKRPPNHFEDPPIQKKAEHAPFPETLPSVLLNMLTTTNSQY